MDSKQNQKQPDQLAADSKPDVRAIMADIRSRVGADAARFVDKRAPFVPRQARDQSERKAGELLYSEELRYLNQNWSYPVGCLKLEAITSHRGWIGRVIVKAKRKIVSMVWEHLLKGYFEAEKDFHTQLVRFLNDTSKYVDARDASNFWELIRKIDYDVNKALERIERISDEQMGSLRATERQIYDRMNAGFEEHRALLQGVLATQAKQSAEMATLDSVARGLERIVARLSGVSSVSVESGVQVEAPKDYRYLLLENRFRGSDQEIAGRMSIYPEMFQGTNLPILEIGPGRGELLGLFRTAGLHAYGIDMDSGMVQAAKSVGLNVEQGDGIAHLRSLPDKSLGGVIATQVIEHLPLPVLNELLSLCRSKVATGGRIVFETIDSESMVALTQHYFRDPTHVWPLHPETMRYMLEMAGLKVLEIRRLSPFAQEACLRTLPVESHMTPRWAMTIERLNNNFERLNSLLFGHQDYCIIAEA